MVVMQFPTLSVPSVLSWSIDPKLMFSFVIMALIITIIASIRRKNPGLAALLLASLGVS